MAAIACFVLGFALGGFFDGILLHQVLQWHHLLSLVEGEAFRDIGVQILADGLFHVLMYAVALAGFWLLWRARGERPGGGAVLGWALLGFGAWNVVDVVGFHWVLGIHRIRVDVPAPLPWDLGWLAAFGLVPIGLGLWLRRRGGPRHASAMLALAVAVAGPVAALPPQGVATVTALFAPGTTGAQVMAAAEAVGGQAVWGDPSGRVWAIDLREGGSAFGLYRHGALLVGGSLLPAGCLNWSRP